MLGAIKEMQKSPPNYTNSVPFILEFFSCTESSCVSNAAKILDKGGFETPGSLVDTMEIPVLILTPIQLWQFLYKKYSKGAIVYGPCVRDEAADLSSGLDNSQNGHEYGISKRNVS